MSERLDCIRYTHNQDEKVHEFDIDWLIEQAERAEHLETVLIGTNKVLDESIASLEKMAHCNNRLREALKFYAEEHKYEDNISTTHGYTCEIAFDEGNTARQALEGDSK
ncbi:MAG: hypothetical protein R3328_00215 [Planococcaceae bacterium]|nr:hypothetical protein [Planococcaceae bacterium]